MANPLVLLARLGGFNLLTYGLEFPRSGVLPLWRLRNG
jgi:hypothetical protein